MNKLNINKMPNNALRFFGTKKRKKKSREIFYTNNRTYFAHENLLQASFNVKASEKNPVIIFNRNKNISKIFNWYT